jgi:hypothetical protein
MKPTLERLFPHMSEEERKIENLRMIEKNYREAIDRIKFRCRAQRFHRYVRGSYERGEESLEKKHHADFYRNEIEYLAKTKKDPVELAELRKEIDSSYVLDSDRSAPLITKLDEEAAKAGFFTAQPSVASQTTIAPTLTDYLQSKASQTFTAPQPPLLQERGVAVSLSHLDLGKTYNRYLSERYVDQVTFDKHVEDLVDLYFFKNQNDDLLIFSGAGFDLYTDDNQGPFQLVESRPNGGRSKKKRKSVRSRRRHKRRHSKVRKL